MCSDEALWNKAALLNDAALLNRGAQWNTGALWNKGSKSNKGCVSNSGCGSFKKQEGGCVRSGAALWNKQAGLGHGRPWLPHGVGTGKKSHR